MLRDFLVYATIGVMVGIVIAMFMLSPEESRWMSDDYTRAMEIVGWVVR